MDEMRLKLSSKFMRGVVSKLASKALSKKLGCKVNIQLHDLDIWSLDGDTTLKANVEVKLNSDEFMKIMNTINQD